jgi:hypothetical protein
MKYAAMIFALIGGAAVAKDRAQCQREIKEFAQQCERVCAQQLSKKNPKAAEACKGNCRSQTAKFEKGCNDGTL